MLDEQLQDGPAASAAGKQKANPVVAEPMLGNRNSLTIRPVIMSGGSGTRLWPLSRQAFPKQLLPIVAEQSMLQETAARVAGRDMAAPLIVAGEEHRHFVKRQLEEAQLPPAALLLEPAQRNTAAAAALAAEWSLAQGGNEVLLLMPSDHLVRDTAAFLDAVGRGLDRAAAGAIVTFGIRPDGPNTEYGYIEGREPEDDGLSPIRRFVEKPDRERALEYVESGRFFWNSGMFLFRPDVFLAELERYLPGTRAAVAQAFAAAEADGLFIRPEAASFLQADNMSIDYGVMEKTDRGFVLPVDIGWSDVGSWNAVWATSNKDEQGNVVHGKVLARDTRNSFVRGDGPATVTTIGLDNMLVVSMRDAVLVAPLARSEEVKALVGQIEADGHDCTKLPSKVARPWGSYESLEEGNRFQIKHITVLPGERLSLQMHYHRSEHWVVVKGTAEVTVGEKVFLLQENQSTFIPAGTTHRLRNPGKVLLELVEVQCGPYLGEDDIVRLDDEYGRG